MPDIPTVETIMTRHVMHVSMDDTLGRVREIFHSVKFHHLVVMDGHRVAGVISARDLLKYLSPFIGKIIERTQDRNTLDRKVHQIMSRRLIACSPGTALKDAGRLMIDHHISCLPVIDGGRCVGILSLRDMLAWSIVQCAGGDDTCPIPAAA